jgi:hypothetical protein
VSKNLHDDARRAALREQERRTRMAAAADAQRRGYESPTGIDGARGPAGAGSFKENVFEFLIEGIWCASARMSPDKGTRA